jgi:hypothetical protein
MSTFILEEFYEAIADDARIGNTHICLYLALVNQGNSFGNFFEINRANLLKNAKISRKTYHKCMKELREYGYIKYEPSNNPFSRSRVLLKRL